MTSLHFTSKSLVAESLKMPHVIKVVTTTVNCMFQMLSRAACLKRFYDRLPEIKMFAEGKKDISQLGNEARIAD